MHHAWKDVRARAATLGSWLVAAMVAGPATARAEQPLSTLLASTVAPGVVSLSGRSVVDVDAREAVASALDLGVATGLGRRLELGVDVDLGFDPIRTASGQRSSALRLDEVALHLQVQAAESAGARPGLAARMVACPPTFFGGTSTPASLGPTIVATWEGPAYHLSANLGATWSVGPPARRALVGRVGVGAAIDVADGAQLASELVLESESIRGALGAAGLIGAAWSVSEATWIDVGLRPWTTGGTMVQWQVVAGVSTRLGR